MTNHELRRPVREWVGDGVISLASFHGRRESGPQFTHRDVGS